MFIMAMFLYIIAFFLLLIGLLVHESVLLVLGFTCVAIGVLLDYSDHLKTKSERCPTCADLNYCDIASKRRKLGEWKIMMLSKQLERQNKLANSDYNPYMQKEQDWAIAGGIAQGIAGPAVGLATAINTEIKNQSIREFNATVAVPMQNIQVAKLRQSANLTESRIQSIRQIISSTQSVTVFSDTKEDLFGMLSIEDASSLEGRKLYVKCRVAIKDSVRNELGNSFCIDGYLCADLVVDGKIIKTVDIMLPFEGISTVRRLLYADNVVKLGYTSDYKIVFRVKELWACNSILPIDLVTSPRPITDTTPWTTVYGVEDFFGKRIIQADYDELTIDDNNKIHAVKGRIFSANRSYETFDTSGDRLS